jgi:hypothetical protein
MAFKPAAMIARFKESIVQASEPNFDRLEAYLARR